MSENDIIDPTEKLFAKINGLPRTSDRKVLIVLMLENEDKESFEAAFAGSNISFAEALTMANSLLHRSIQHNFDQHNRG